MQIEQVGEKSGVNTAGENTSGLEGSAEGCSTEGHRGAKQREWAQGTKTRRRPFQEDLSSFALCASNRIHSLGDF